MKNPPSQKKRQVLVAKPIMKASWNNSNSQTAGDTRKNDRSVVLKSSGPPLLPPDTERFFHAATGWVPDCPDSRDWTLDHKDMASLKQHFPLYAASETTLKKAIADLAKKAESGNTNEVDIRDHCSPTEYQGAIGSCTAHAVSGMVEHLWRKEAGVGHDPKKEIIDVDAGLEISRLFLYKVTRNLMGMKGDTGATIRETIKALRLFGYLPESLWPYIEADFDVEPEAFHYAYASNFKDFKYIRLDGYPGSKKKADDSLLNLRRALTSGLTVVFGFPLYSNATDDGMIPPPPEHNCRMQGGHAALAVGFNDKDEQVIIQNSWGTKWGEDGGFGKIDYDYFRRGLALDLWTIVPDATKPEI